MHMMATESFSIEREDHDGKGRYVIRFDGREAEMTYAHGGENLFIIDHTYVPPSMRGKGFAEALVARGVADARAEGSKILPLCSYVRTAFRRHPEWRDVLNDTTTFSVPDGLKP